MIQSEEYLRGYSDAMRVAFGEGYQASECSESRHPGVSNLGPLSNPLVDQVPPSEHSGPGVSALSNPSMVEEFQPFELRGYMISTYKQIESHFNTFFIWGLEDLIQARRIVFCGKVRRGDRVLRILRHGKKKTLGKPKVVDVLSADSSKATCTDGRSYSIDNLYRVANLAPEAEQ